MSIDAIGFEAFMHERSRAAQAYVTGDPGPLVAMATTQNPATFFGPQGGRVEGAHAVVSNYQEATQQFAPGGDTNLEILHQGSSGDLAYWVGIQHAHVHMIDQSEPVEMHLRITEVFRCEDNDWKLIHRHADASSPDADQSDR